MRQNRMSGLMSGMWKRSTAVIMGHSPTKGRGNSEPNLGLNHRATSRLYLGATLVIEDEYRRPLRPEMLLPADTHIDPRQCRIRRRSPDLRAREGIALPGGEGPPMRDGVGELALGQPSLRRLQP